MTKFLIAALVVIPTVALAVERPECPSPGPSDRALGRYVNAHLTYIGTLGEPDSKAIDAIALTECVVRWCQAQPISQSTRAKAEGAAIQASQDDATRPDAARLLPKLKACPIRQPETRTPWAGITATLIAATAGGLAIWTGLEAQSLNDDVSDLSQATDPDDCGGRNETDCRSYWGSLDQRAGRYEVATGALVGAAAVSAGLAIWWFIDSPFDDDRATILPIIGRKRAGLGLGLNF